MTGDMRRRVCEALGCQETFCDVPGHTEIAHRPGCAAITALIEEERARFNEAHELAIVQQGAMLMRLQENDTEIQALRERLKVVEGALAFYANPETYYAIGFIGDPPYGEFLYDVDEIPGKPGARARAALAGSAENWEASK